MLQELWQDTNLRNIAIDNLKDGRWPSTTAVIERPEREMFTQRVMDTERRKFGNQSFLPDSKGFEVLGTAAKDLPKYWRANDKQSVRERERINCRM